MKSIASVLSIIALGFGLLGCPSGGGSGDSTPGFAVSTTAADYGVVGNPYTSTLVATGGTAPFSWMLFVGALPAGLTLNPGTDVVSGTPTTAGNVTATFTVTDGTGKTATGSVLFSIHTRTDRVSVDGNGVAGDGASSRPSINSDGSLVAFVSLATNLLAPGTPAVAGQQVYVHNRQTNQIELVSRDNSVSVVNEGNGVSSASVISTDGRYVVFVSQATNLLAPDPAVPAGQQIYVRDRQTGLTSLVSVDNDPVTPNPGNGISSVPSISGDGRYVAFVSQATNLLAPDPAVPAGQQIYVRDRQTGLTSLVSVDNDPVTPHPGDGISSAPSISGNGRYVAFVSQATNLLAPDPAVPAGQQIYVRDRQTGLTSLVSVDNDPVTPNPGNGISSVPSISGDGRYVAFVSQATNLLAPDPAVPAGQQIYVRDRQTGLTSLVSVDNDPVTPNPGNGISSVPSISGDGRYVAFVSQATNLLEPVVVLGGQQIYFRDRQLGMSFLASQDNTNTNIAGAGGISDTPSMNSDGGFVAFFSQATNLVAGSGAHIYVRALP